MAFNFTAPAAAATAPAVASNGNYEKAISFLNFSLPSTEGGQMKLGAIALKLSVESEKGLHDWLVVNGGDTAKLKEILIINFNAVNTTRTFALA